MAAVTSQWSCVDDMTALSHCLCHALSLSGHTVLCLVTTATPEEVDDAAECGVRLVVQNVTREGESEQLQILREFAPVCVLGFGRLNAPAALMMVKSLSCKYVHFVRDAPSAMTSVSELAFMQHAVISFVTSEHSALGWHRKHHCEVEVLPTSLVRLGSAMVPQERLTDVHLILTTSGGSGQMLLDAVQLCAEILRLLTLPPHHQARVTVRGCSPDLAPQVRRMLTQSQPTVRVETYSSRLRSARYKRKECLELEF